MIRLIPLLFFLIYSFNGFCQNYRLVQPGVIRYFTNADHYLRAARVDSVTINGTDTVLHLFRSPKGKYEEDNGATVKLYPTGSWLGKTVTIQPDGTHIFDNYWGNKITVKTQFTPADGVWVFQSENSSQWYNALVSAVDTMTVNGAIDSVKEITILPQNITNDSFGFSKLYFSKNNGWVTVCDLYMFPYREPGKQYKKGNDYLPTCYAVSTTTSRDQLICFSAYRTLIIRICWSFLIMRWVMRF